MTIRTFSRPCRAAVLLAALALAACVDPMRDIERLSDADLAEGEAARMAEAADSPAVGGEGFLGQLLGGGTGGGPAEDAPETETEDEVTLAAAAPAPAPRRGLFGGLFDARAEPTPDQSGPDAVRVPEGMAVPYGAVGTNCAVRRGQMGTRVLAQSGFEIWDTNPTTTALRTHYITGFDDGCARQFSGALVIASDVGTHEVVRYSDVTVDQPYSEVDTAYEEIKSAFCRVQPRQPCGARLEALGQRTAFLTVYETFGSGPSWVEILLHDGAVAAVARKGG